VGISAWRIHGPRRCREDNGRILRQM